MAKIKSVKAREILDSRGNPTVETDVVCSDGTLGRASVPSGASTGKFEARELRDSAKKRYGGKGVLKAVENSNRTLERAIRGMDVSDQKKIDAKMIEKDGTKSKSRIGANSILGVSLAVAHAAAQSRKTPLYRYLTRLYGSVRPSLPVPFMNIINGGAHADNNLDIQEFMLVPHGFKTFSDSLRAGVEIFHALKSLLKSKGLSTAVGDEGGFAPNLRSNEHAMEFIARAAEKAGYKTGTQVSLAMDAAASEFFFDGKYRIGRAKLSSAQMGKMYEKWTKNWPLISIEDPMDENDWEGWKEITERVGRSVQLVGDDLFVTNRQRLEKGIKLGAANSILIKVNQIGTLSETFDAMKTAGKAGYSRMVSHRSGETEDSSIADIAVATECGRIKTGAPCRGERTAKYNRLLRIEEELGKKAVFAGKQILGKI
ncbi:MAG: phosphopyruvate hydratase [Candidatus Mycalebacterium zealandia]|nr:MAG: phosphopyruvate hydratase [Candidatus Mycalebacterium zealandia]